MNDLKKILSKAALVYWIMFLVGLAIFCLAGMVVILVDVWNAGNPISFVIVFSIGLSLLGYMYFTFHVVLTKKIVESNES